MNEYRNKSQKQLREPFHLSFFLVQLFEHSAECVLYTAFIAFSVGILRYLNSTVIDRSAGAVISVIGSNADCHLHACAFSGTCCRNRTVRYIPVYRNFVTDSDAETYRIFTIHCAEVFIGFRIEFNIRIPLIQ